MLNRKLGLWCVWRRFASERHGASEFAINLRLLVTSLDLFGFSSNSIDCCCSCQERFSLYYIWRPGENCFSSSLVFQLHCRKENCLIKLDHDLVSLLQLAF